MLTQIKRFFQILVLESLQFHTKFALYRHYRYAALTPLIGRLETTNPRINLQGDPAARAVETNRYVSTSWAGAATHTATHDEPCDKRQLIVSYISR